MFRYSAYGLTVESDLELRGLRVVEPSVTSADVEVRCMPVPLSEEQAKGNWHRIEPRQSHLVWEGVGSFLIQDGLRIHYQQASEATHGSVSQAVLGPAMGLLLQQRGLVPLHASALAIDGVAIGIAGDSGMGKSTTAQALHSRHHVLVTDDIAALSCDDGQVTVRPGHAALRLWPDSMLRVDVNPAAHERLHAETQKRRHDLSDGVATEPLRLASIVVLCDGDEERLERLSAPHSAFELLRHYYYPELTGAVSSPSVLLQQCGDIAERLAVYRLHRRKTADAIAGMVALIERCSESPKSGQ